MLQLVLTFAVAADTADLVLADLATALFAAAGQRSTGTRAIYILFNRCYHNNSEHTTDNTGSSKEEEEEEKVSKMFLVLSNKLSSGNSISRAGYTYATTILYELYMYKQPQQPQPPPPPPPQQQHNSVPCMFSACVNVGHVDSIVVRRNLLFNAVSCDSFFCFSAGACVWSSAGGYIVEGHPKKTTTPQTTTRLVRTGEGRRIFCAVVERCFCSH